ncbi:MAG: L,D-transpeptidase [Rhodoblastus sp.]|nr:L,D-transpeptidase [Rhodoblastus sp.]
MSPLWRIMLLAGVAAIASEPALAGGYGGGFIEFVMTGGQQAAPQRDPFAQPRMTEPAMQAAPVLRNLPPTVHRPVQVASYGTAPLETKRSVAAEYLRAEVDYQTTERPGTIVVDTRDKHLYLVQAGGRAIRYGIGVGRPGFTWSGVKTVTRKAEWPGWTPPPEMIKRRPDLPKHMEGGPSNPLGARALYLGSSLYRIHGTNEPYTIGQNVSSGCIRMMNQDVEDLYDRVRVGTKVIVL